MAADQAPNPFDVLGVPPDASEAEIRAAWKRQLVYWHPDRRGSAGEIRTKPINVAYDELKDPTKRAESARKAASGWSGGAASPSPAPIPSGPPSGSGWAPPPWTPPPRSGRRHGASSGSPDGASGSSSRPAGSGTASSRSAGWTPPAWTPPPGSGRRRPAASSSPGAGPRSSARHAGPAGRTQGIRRSTHL